MVSIHPHKILENKVILERENQVYDNVKIHIVPSII